MKTVRQPLYHLVLVCLVLLNILHNSEDARLLLSRGGVQLIDGLYWSLYWLEGLEEYNNRSGYMSGNWVPVAAELNRVELTDITWGDGGGSAAADLASGAFYRIGTNLRCWPPSNAHHPFNGDAMIHRIEVTNSSLFYSNAWVEEDVQPTAADTLTVAGGGRDLMCSTCAPAFSFGDVNTGSLTTLLRLLLVRLRAHLVLGLQAPLSQERSQAGQTNIVSLGTKTYAVGEVVLPFEIDVRGSTAASRTDQQQLKAVSPIGFSDLDGLLGAKHNSPAWNGPAEAPMSAHPRTDPRTGETFFFSVNHGTGVQPFVNFVRLHATPTDSSSGTNKKGTRLQIPVPGPLAAFYHDMFLTEHYAIIVHSSLRRDPARLARGHSLNYFDASEPLRFGILPRSARSADEMVWIAAPGPGHIWHTATGHEMDNDTLVLYAPKFNSYADNVPIHLASEAPSYLTRFVVNLANRTCTEVRIFDEVVERPTVNPDRLAHRYVYLRSEGVKSQETGGRIVKFDLLSERLVGSFECGNTGSACLFGEALFVPRTMSSGDTELQEEEDDGYLMDIVYTADTHSSTFSVWSAASMANRPLVTAGLPQRVPHGAHGAWLKSFM